MKKLVFGFSRPNRWKAFSAAIMLFDWRKTDGEAFNHGYAKFSSDRWNSDFIYQSSEARTNFMGGELFNKKNVIVEEYALEVEDRVEGKIGRLCVSREGRPYPVKMVVGIAIVKLLGLMGKMIKNPFPSDNENCIGELAYLLSDGLGISCPLDMETVTPREFRDWLITVPGIERIK